MKSEQHLCHTRRMSAWPAVQGFSKISCAHHVQICWNKAGNLVRKLAQIKYTTQQEGSAEEVWGNRLVGSRILDNNGCLSKLALVCKASEGA